MKESESLFDVVLDQIVEPMPRAEIADRVAVISVPMPAPLEPCETCDGSHAAGEPCGMLETADDSGLGWMSGGVPPALVREHPPEIRELLRRAGLSMRSELAPDELERCRRATAGAVPMFPDPYTPAAKIREYIMPRQGLEG